MFKALQLCDTKFTSVSKSVDGKDEVEWEEVKAVVLKEAEPERSTPLGAPARAFRAPSPRGQPSCHRSLPVNHRLPHRQTNLKRK